MKLEFSKSFLIIPILLLTGLFICLYSQSFTVGNGNFVTLTFVKNSLEGTPLWYADSGTACQVSPAFSLFSFFSKTSGFSIEQTWIGASMLVIILGVIAYFLLVSSFFGQWAGLASSLLALLVIDEHALLSLAIPRHIVLFVLAPFSLYFLFQWLNKGGNKNFAASAILTAAAFATHLLFGFLLLLSITTLMLLRLLRRDFVNAKKIFLFLAAASTFCALLSFNSISAAASFSHPYYGDAGVWQTAILGIPIINPAKVLYSPKIALYFAAMMLCALPFLLHATKSKRPEEDFLAGNIVAALLLVFTPLALLLAKLITPGVLAEQVLWKLAPFYAVIPASALLLYKEKTKISQALALLAILLALSYPLFFFKATLEKPSIQAREFLGSEAITLLENKNVASDLHSSYLLPYYANATVLTTDAGYLVCAKANDFERLKALEVLLSDKPVYERQQIAANYGVNAVFLNKKAWDLRLVQDSESKVVRLPSFEEAVANAEKLGFVRKNLEGGLVVFLRP